MAMPLEHPYHHLSLTRERIHCRVSHGDNHNTSSVTRNKQTCITVLCISTILWLSHSTAEKSEWGEMKNSDCTYKPNELSRLQHCLPEGNPNTATKCLYPIYQMKRPKHISQLQMDIFQLKKSRYLEELRLYYLHIWTILLLISLRFSDSTQWSSPENKIVDNHFSVTCIYKDYGGKEAARIPYNYINGIHLEGLRNTVQDSACFNL